jgi:NADH:ubiquinone oxidoreductase subunit K
VLLIGWVLFLHATLESLGLFGIILAAAFFGTLTWVFFDQGWMSAGNDIVTYVSLVVLAAILTVGMAWSHIWRRLSGQVEIDEDGRNR